MLITLNVNSAILFTWMVLVIVWLAGLASTKATVHKQPTAARTLHVAILLLGYFMVGLKWFGVGWLGMRFAPSLPSLPLVGLALTIAGCLFAIWARLTLGANWSGRATVKADHELIVKGPYALARHPIYTGLLVAFAGTALTFGEWRCVVGFALIASGFAIKMTQEERLMMQTFPLEYPKYRQRVKALIPGVL